MAGDKAYEFITHDVWAMVVVAGGCGSRGGRRLAENQLYYGDNLDILRRYVKEETVDLVYLDSPRQNYLYLRAELTRPYLFKASFASTHVP
jgi:hypothetical protein